MQKLLSNPRVFRDLIDRQIEELDRLVERAMKKKPKSEKQELAAVAGG